jgi:uncharacterized membrane protein (UPF0127 family)
MPHRLLFLLFPALLSLLSLFWFTGCDGIAQASTDSPLPASHQFSFQLNEKTIQAELALSPKEMARGLMERTEMDENDGMVFLYGQPIQASFWMKNTLIPLDIGYFNSEGVLLEVYRMYPRDESAVQSRSKEIRFALEMNQGWFSANRIRPGAVLDLQGLRNAVVARGFSPEEFGL